MPNVAFRRQKRLVKKRSVYGQSTPQGGLPERLQKALEEQDAAQQRVARCAGERDAAHEKVAKCAGRGRGEAFEAKLVEAFANEASRQPPQPVVAKSAAPGTRSPCHIVIDIYI